VRSTIGSPLAVSTTSISIVVAQQPSAAANSRRPPPGKFATSPALANIVKFELWGRAGDPSEPLRLANVVNGADRLNKGLGAQGSGKPEEVAVHESPAPGFDDDALQLMFTE
jgi:hypothetical protein